MSAVDWVRSLLGLSPSSDDAPETPRCGCGYPMPDDSSPQRAVTLHSFSEVTETAETDAAIIDTYRRMWRFRCVDCGEVFVWADSVTWQETEFKDDAEVDA